MNKFKKIGLLCVMFLALAAALLLPKFVQHSTPGKSKSNSRSDLADTLVDMKVIDQGSYKSVDEVTASDNLATLKMDPRFKEFFVAIDSQDFEKARGHYLAISKGISESEKAQLTAQLEKAISEFSAATSPKIVKRAVTEKPAIIIENEPSLESTASPQDTSQLVTNVDKVNAELMALQKESIAQLKESAKELAAATKATRAAAEEASKARAQVTAAKQESNFEQTREIVEPLKLPETISIAFAFNSTSLSRNDKRTLAPIVKALKNEPRLKVQLRGYTDLKGSAEYNAILARARCEVIRDMFVEQGVNTKRLSVISFGETQAKRGNTSGNRRVELIFRE